jgi:hypothetical protein
MPINKEYAELVYANSILANKKPKTSQDEEKIRQNSVALTKIELGMPASDIISSIKEAFKHIPPRH